MDATLARLSDPRLELASMMCEAVTIIRGYLEDPGLGGLAFRSAVASVLDELCPPPPPPDDALLLPGVIPAGAGPGDAARVIAEQLLSSPSPATALLARLAGEEIGIRVTDSDIRPLSVLERRRLHAAAGTRCWHRAGELVTASGITAARTRLTVIPGLLPAGVLDGLAGGVPFGALAARHGMTRQARAAALTGKPDPAVESTALLVIRGQYAGIAWEQVTGGFCGHLARAAAGPVSVTCP